MSGPITRTLPPSGGRRSITGGGLNVELGLKLVLQEDALYRIETLSDFSIL
jgi:hypothetical protein